MENIEDAVKLTSIEEIELEIMQRNELRTSMIRTSMVGLLLNQNQVLG